MVRWLHSLVHIIITGLMILWCCVIDSNKYEQNMVELRILKTMLKIVFFKSVECVYSS